MLSKGHLDTQEVRELVFAVFPEGLSNQPLFVFPFHLAVCTCPSSFSLQNYLWDMGVMTFRAQTDVATFEGHVDGLTSEGHADGLTSRGQMKLSGVSIFLVVGGIRAVKDPLFLVEAFSGKAI